MIVDITSGVKADGTLVARTGWIAIDNGAYTADAAFFRSWPQCMSPVHMQWRP